MKTDIIWFSEVLFFFFAYCNVILSVIILFVEAARFSRIFPLCLLDSFVQTANFHCPFSGAQVQLPGYLSISSQR